MLPRTRQPRQRRRAVGTARGRAPGLERRAFLGALALVLAPRPAPAATALETAAGELDLILPSRRRAARDFALPTLEGARVRLRDLQGQVVFVNFWATWCLPCREEMPAMERLWQRHRAAGFAMVAIAVDAKPDPVGPFVKQLGLTFPIALDPRMEVAHEWAVRALPSSFLLDRQGRHAALALGPRAWDHRAAHAVVRELLAA